MELVESPLGTLRPTLKAAKMVTATCGSFMEATRKLGDLDQNTFFAVIAAGLGKARPADVEDAVFELGLHVFVQPCFDFVALLSNGGRSIKVAMENAKPGE